MLLNSNCGVAPPFAAGAVLEEEPMVNCPLCDAAIDVEEDELDEGDSLICEECGANLSVSGVSPLEISPDKDDDDPDEDEDFDEDDDDEDDDDVEDDEEEEDEED
jgi:alpha-aminoadipate carrier protein LysW